MVKNNKVFIHPNEFQYEFIKLAKKEANMYKSILLQCNKAIFNIFACNFFKYCKTVS